MKIFLFTLLFQPFTSWASLIYLPNSFQSESAKLVVVIHGCLQSAESMAFGTGWDQIADNNNLVVLYPQVPEGANPLSCWNWFLPENQRPNEGQLKFVMDEITSLRERLNLKRETYLMGISSGGATVAGLMACFPKSFKAGAIHSGASYGLAQTFEQGELVLKDGPAATVSSTAPCRPQDFAGSVLIIQGTADTKVNPKNALRIVADFMDRNLVGTERTSEYGDTNYKQTDFISKRKTRVRLIMIEGLGHAWSGYTQDLRHEKLLGPGKVFPTAIPFFSEKGPSATKMAWDFFSNL